MPSHRGRPDLVNAAEIVENVETPRWPCEGERGIASSPMPTPSPDAPAYPMSGIVSLSLSQAMQRATADYQRGALGEAEWLCRRMLEAKADHFDALNLLGSIAIRTGRKQEAVEWLGRAVAARPTDAAARINQGVALQALMRPAEALESYRQAIRLMPDIPEAHNNLGFTLRGLGRLDEALASCERALELKPAYVEAHNNRGIALQELKRPEEALASYDRALQLQPDYAQAHVNRGSALQQLQRPLEALASFARAIELQPDFAEAHNHRGIALQELKRLDEALASYDRALALKPDYADACNNRGSVLQKLKRPQEALDSFERALRLAPDRAEVHNHRGLALQALARLDEALQSYERAIRLKPGYADALNNRGAALRELRRLDAALASYDRALELKPDFAEAWNNRGIALRELGRLDEALASYDRALLIMPEFPGAHYNRGNALRQVGRCAEAAESFTQVLALAPGFGFAKGSLLHAKMLCCDWTGLADLSASIGQDCLARKPSADPFGHQAICNSEEELRTCAEVYAATCFPARELPAFPARRGRGEKIRVGYLSGEFRHQATSLLMAELFELHDRKRIELFAFDNGRDDGSETRARINKAFGDVVAIDRMSDLEAASAVKARGIDILVNLNGYFGDARQDVFAYRPSPIQVNYLGFPGTIGADYIDYLIADRTVIPEASRQHYVEKIAWMPNCYQVNDRRKAISDKVFAREELGLPRTGFVFCCFNNNYKITPGVFDGWMRILQRVDGSVLWLLESNPAAAGNLRRACAARGVGPERLIFARPMPLAEHLARHRAADLFLDTLPYNAHTTASDALWAGLPLITRPGQTFPGRVAASLLKAIDMPELITATQEQYEALAVELATHSRRLELIRHKLTRNRLTAPLFDTPLFARHIEDAYAQMYARYQADLPPDHFAVRS
jgi:protein O-GlcNAc transferase